MSGLTLLLIVVVVVGLIVWLTLDKPPVKANGAGPWDYEDDEEEQV